MTYRRPLIALAALAAAAGLSACVSLLPKSDPVKLYTFGHATVAVPAQGLPETQRIGVLMADVDFPRAAQGDEILTLTGSQVAYIANTRWAAPAVLLFREALERRFEQAGRARLLNRGEPGKTGLILRIEVRDFQANYAYPEAVPEVAVTLQARLSRVDGSDVQERTFQFRKPAPENRVSLIVDTMDEGVSQTLGELAAWTDEVAAGVPLTSTTPNPPRGQGRATTNSTSTSTTITTTARPVAP